jgi:hypothetical protein
MMRGFWPRSLRSLLARCLVSAGAAALVPVIGTTDARADTATQQACVFYSTGQTHLGIEFGHVGWAVGGGDQWLLGSADGGGKNSGVSGSRSGSDSSTVSDGSSWPSESGSASSGGSSGSSGSPGSSASSNGTGFTDRPVDQDVPHYTATDAPWVWVARSASFDNVKQDFSSFGWYSAYRCKTVQAGDLQAAYDLAQNDGGFMLFGNNCLNHAWAAINAFKPGMLSAAPWTPHDWFYTTLGNDDGFAAPVSLS